MKNKLTWLEGALVLAPMIALVIFWKQLPERVPIHWNGGGQINRWASKYSLLELPLVSLMTVCLLHFLPWIDPKLRRASGGQGRMQSALQILRLALATCFGAVFAMLLAAALGHGEPMSSRLVPSAVLVLFAIIGNYSSNLRPNYFVGLRTPWTLESPETWRATHRLGGQLMFFGSIILLLLQFFLSQSAFAPVFLTSLILFVVWAVWYSWHHFHTQGAAPLPASKE
jgi:uncharacterized membrane protein